MLVKICGTTTLDDALVAHAAGADAIGFVFAASKRQVDAATVASIVAELPAGALTVGVFRGQSADEILDIVAASGVDAIQLHGDESPSDVARVRHATDFLIQAFTADDPRLEHLGEYEVDAILLDSPSPGSGETFDWSLIEGLSSQVRVILAGGLDADNVAMAIERVRPWGVDVASGVESSPGHKDAAEVRRFVTVARDALSEFSADPGSA